MACVDIQLRYVDQTDSGVVQIWLVSPTPPPLVLEAWNQIGGISENDNGWYSVRKLLWRRYGRDGMPIGRVH